MINKVILIGNVGRTPKVALTQTGKQMATFSLATTHSSKDETGEWQSATDWHRITIFRETTARWIKNNLKQGDMLSVEGKLSYHQWTDKFGQNRHTPHVVIFEKEGRIQRLFLSNATANNNVSQSSNLTPQKDLGTESLGNDSLEDNPIGTKSLENKSLEDNPLSSVNSSTTSEEANFNSHQEDEITDPPLETIQEENPSIYQKRSAQDE